jgi:uroporphyrinogen decarboxylase
MTRKALLDVLNGVEPVRRPVWVMRQAGRYLPEYRAVRTKAGSFLDLCYNPELAAEVTLQPLRRFDFDAAILFSDILVVPHAMGLALRFEEGEGPILDTVTSSADVSRLLDVSGTDQVLKVCETVRRVKADLAPHIGFIGFCGAPWTVASYMIEGRGSDRKRALAVAIENPDWFSKLIDRLVDASVKYLLAQIEAGVETVQIFDSWAGDVPLAARRRVVEEPIAAIVLGVRAVKPGFPVIVFGRGVGGGHVALAEYTGANAVGVEQGTSLSALVRELPDGVAVQGNLAPESLLLSDGELTSMVGDVLNGVPMRRHIFNLGHGITPQVDPVKLQVMLDAIRAHDGA